MNKAVFLDRDGTINVDYGYVYQYEKFEYIDGVKETLRTLQDMGYKLIIITNQSGIARGYYTEEDMKALHEKMCADLENEGIHIEDIYYCPHLSGCSCRKPKTSLFYRAAREHKIDFARSIAVGDKIRDLCICGEEPVKGFLISSSKDKEVLDTTVIDSEADKFYKEIVQIEDMREIPAYLKD